LVEENYSWANVVKGFARTLEDVVNSYKPGKVSSK
jgi:hypothetical protein